MDSSLVTQLVKNLPAMQETLVRYLSQEDSPGEDIGYPLQYLFLGFPGGSDGKESACNAGDLGLIPELGRSPTGGHGIPPPKPRAKGEGGVKAPGLGGRAVQQ